MLKATLGSFNFGSFDLYSHLSHVLFCRGKSLPVWIINESLQGWVDTHVRDWAHKLPCDPWASHLTFAPTMQNEGTRLGHQLKDALAMFKSELDVTVKRTRQDFFEGYSFLHLLILSFIISLLLSPVQG